MGGDGAIAATGAGRACDGRDLCLDGACRGDDLPGDRSSQFCARRDGDVLDVSRLADAPMGLALLGCVRRRRGAVVCRRCRDRADPVQADPKRTDPEPACRVHRSLWHPQQLRRVDLGLQHQDLSEPVRLGPAVRLALGQHPSSRDDRSDIADAGFALFLLPRLAPRSGHARRRDEPGIGAARRHPRRLDDRARLGDVGRGRRRRRNADRAGRLSRAEHDAGRPPLWFRGCCPRRAVEPRWRGGWRFCGRRHRKPRRNLHPLCRARAEADDRPGADRRCADVQAERGLWPHGGEPGMTSQSRETIALASEPPRARAIARPSLRQILIALAVLVAVVVPFVLKSFFIFQLTLVMVYGLAILGLNLLTGFNGQFSLGHSAFYGIGAYTAAILMEQLDIAYYWTLPCAG